MKYGICILWNSMNVRASGDTLFVVTADIWWRRYSAVALSTAMMRTFFIGSVQNHNPEYQTFSRSTDSRRRCVNNLPRVKPTVTFYYYKYCVILINTSGWLVEWPSERSVKKFFKIFLMIRRPPRSTPLYSSAASDVYKRQTWNSSKSAVARYTNTVCIKISTRNSSNWTASPTCHD